MWCEPAKLQELNFYTLRRPTSYLKLLKHIKIIFYYENGDTNFPSIHSLFQTSSLSACYSAGASNMAITDIDTKLISICASDLQRLEDDRNHMGILEWRLIFFWQVVNPCFIEKFRDLTYVKMV